MAVQLGQREYLVWGEISNPNTPASAKMVFDAIPVTIDIEEYNTNNAATIKNSIVDFIYNTVVNYDGFLLIDKKSIKREWVMLKQVNRL